MTASRLRQPEYRGRASCGPEMLVRPEFETPRSQLETSGRYASVGRSSYGGSIEDSTVVRNISGKSLVSNFSDAAEQTFCQERSQRLGHIRVAVRVRPLPSNEEGIIEVAGSGAVAIRKEAATGGNEFLSSQRGRVEERTFDQVFGPDATQKEVFTWSCGSLLSEAVSRGRNATVFVYGATGAGKTHTMFGGHEQEQQGIIFRAIPEVFNQLADKQLEEDGRFEVKLSFLEIYNEVVRDMLQEGGGNGQCRVLEDEKKGVVKVSNLVEAAVQNADEAFWFLRAGMQARTVEATAANSQSSRAHAVFTLSIELVKSTSPDGPFAKTRCTEVRQQYSKISLIDLAGSERASFTQNTGAALKDGARINQSLLALANCIDALTASTRRDTGATPRKKPPYRDSKLTLMLKGSLTGDGMVAMIANVHPGRSHFEDSNNTLEYAKRASVVKATHRRLSKPGRQTDELQPRCQVQHQSYDNRFEESCSVGSSSSSTLPHSKHGYVSRRTFDVSRLRSHPSSTTADSAAECLSELSVGSHSQESSEDGLPGSSTKDDAELTPLETVLPSHSAELCLGEECLRDHSSYDALKESNLAIALKLIAQLQKEKILLDERLKHVTKDRDALIEDKEALETGNEELRSAGFEKDKLLAKLLTRSR